MHLTVELRREGKDGEREQKPAGEARIPLRAETAQQHRDGNDQRKAAEMENAVGHGLCGLGIQKGKDPVPCIHEQVTSRF